VACLSGLKSTSRKRVLGNQPWVQIPPPPPGGSAEVNDLIPRKFGPLAISFRNTGINKCITARESGASLFEVALLHLARPFLREVKNRKQ
jgi:hypothetical protein